ncbi:MAG: hypothetical protein WDW38_007541 [Sanguina aurantia]
MFAHALTVALLLTACVNAQGFGGGGGASTAASLAASSFSFQSRNGGQPQGGSAFRGNPPPVRAAPTTAVGSSGDTRNCNYYNSCGASTFNYFSFLVSSNIICWHLISAGI